MKKAIVNFSNNEERYIKQQKRQQESLSAVFFDGDYFTWNTFQDIKCPEHDEVPYAFKPYSIRKVAAENNTELLLWMDAPIYATQTLDNLFNHIEKEGYILFNNIGFTVGDYTSDACLKQHGITREEAFKIPMIMACCMGFNVQNETAKEFLKQYHEASKDGVSFEGDWNNNNLQVSTDSRVKGHRHDQSVASILAHKLGMKLNTGHKTYFTYFNHDGMKPVADSVCLYSHGGF